MTRYALAVDLKKCVGCKACVVACKAENEVPDGVFRLTTYEVEKGSFPEVDTELRHDQCRHCETAPCVSVCPTKASYTDDEGLVRIDYSKCIGCKACMVACPYDARFINPEGGYADKCTYCIHRVKEGKEPACVNTCPTGARVFGDLDNPDSEIRKSMRNNRVSAPKEEAGTNPKFYYLNKELEEVKA
ncbi:MAG: 4Fe-4S dicluster domain-containing protein [Candidatus Bipolaricaulota bacterium]